VNQRGSCGVETGVNMANTVDNPDTGQTGTDWLAVLRLAVIASVVAGLAAYALGGVVAETTIVVCVIVAATMASWFQIEHPRPATRRIHERRR
jgi:uncharacterized membrane-anchored protein